MTINQFLGLDHFDTDTDGKRWPHSKKYTAMVRALGFEEVRALLPFSKEELADALAKDKQLNGGLPRPFSWDNAAVFRCDGLGGVYRVSFIGSPLIKLYEAHGIRGYDVADGVCILKQCARMLIKRKRAS